MQQPERVKKFQYHQIECYLEDVRSLRFCILLFGHAKEHTPLPLECPQVNVKVRRVSRCQEDLRDTRLVGTQIPTLLPVTELPTLLPQYRLKGAVEVCVSSRFINDIKYRRRVPEMTRHMRQRCR
jgi:hypothetical protein